MPIAPVKITPQEALQRTIEHREIFHDEMLKIMRMIMSGEMSPVMATAIITALRVKKETVGEITAAAGDKTSASVVVPANAVTDKLPDHGKPMAQRLILDLFECLSDEALDQQCARLRLRNAARAQVEHHVGVDLGNRCTVATDDVVGVDFEFGLGVGGGGAVKQHGADRLAGIGAIASPSEIAPGTGSSSSAKKISEMAGISSRASPAKA